MRASRSRKKYEVPETSKEATHDLNLRRNSQADTVSSRFVSANMSPSRRSDFPFVNTKPTTSHSEVRPEWAVPKFSRWAMHAQERIDNQGKYRAQESLSRLLKFAHNNAERYSVDKLLSPRTLFKEVFDKHLDQVTERECFIVDTFVEERKRIWRAEDKAAQTLQCYWRCCSAKLSLQAKRHNKQLEHELDMADRRLRHDAEISRVLAVEGGKALEAEEARSRILRYEEEQEAKRRRHEESWIVGFIAAGGVKKPSHAPHSCFLNGAP